MQSRRELQNHKDKKRLEEDTSQVSWWTALTICWGKANKNALSVGTQTLKDIITWKTLRRVQQRPSEFDWKFFSPHPRRNWCHTWRDVPVWPVTREMQVKPQSHATHIHSDGDHQNQNPKPQKMTTVGKGKLEPCAQRVGMENGAAAVNKQYGGSPKYSTLKWHMIQQFHLSVYTRKQGTVMGTPMFTAAFIHNSQNLKATQVRYSGVRWWVNGQARRGRYL